MMTRFDLRSRFQTQGVFWDSKNPNDRVSAHLSGDARRIELTTSAVLAGPDKLFTTLEQDKVPEVIHGLTTSGAVHLVRASRAAHGGVL